MKGYVGKEYGRLQVKRSLLLYSKEHPVKTIPCPMQYEYRVSAFDIYSEEALQLLA